MTCAIRLALFENYLMRQPLDWSHYESLRVNMTVGHEGQCFVKFDLNRIFSKAGA
jgi:hypothetical protein